MDQLHIREACKQKLLTMVRSVVPQVGNGWKVLVGDTASIRILSSACNMLEILEENVTVVENITCPRKAMPNMEAIYFLSPTAESVDALLQDFKDKDKPMYEYAHLFFTSKPKDAEYVKISSSEHITLRVMTIREFDMEFIAHESQAFHLDMPGAMVGIFDRLEHYRYCDLAATRLVTLMETLNENPIIRYAEDQRMASVVASTVQEKLNALTHRTLNEDRSILLILDRTLDPISPLLHEFTYQAMVYDLLDITNDKYSYEFTSNKGEKQQKEAILDEFDTLWPKLRHMHIADATEWVTNNFNQLIATNKASKLASGNKIEDSKELGEAMRAMPQYNSMVSKYSLHVQLSNAVMDIFKKTGLEKIGHLEQDMATRRNTKHKAPKDVVDRLLAVLFNDAVAREDKLRLVILYIIYKRGLREKKYKHLLEVAKFSKEDQAIISNISALGVKVIKNKDKDKKKKQLKKKSKKNNEGEKETYELSRYTPYIGGILECLITDTLSSTDYPFTQGVPDPSTKTPTKARPVSFKGVGKGKKIEDNKPKGPPVIIFILGGMTHAEMRTAYEISAASQRSVLIGSTHIITPKKFLNDLTKLWPSP